MTLPFLRTPFWRLFMITILGFASGLPLALTGTALQTWLTVENVDISTIGFFSLVGLPYTFKFLWAPLMDRFEPKFFGRRKGWIIATQLALAASLALLSTFKPTEQTELLSLIAVFVAFLSASQDIVIDAYRTDILESNERGLGSSLTVAGYRFAMILSGGIALVWADVAAGNGWSWPKIYMIMATIMFVMSIVTFIFLPSLPASDVAPTSKAKNDLIGFLSLMVVVVIGYLFTVKIAAPAANSLLTHVFPALPDGKPDPNLKKWADLISLFVGLGFTLPLGAWTSKKAQFETLNNSLNNFFGNKGAYSILALIVLYKLGDAFAFSLTSTFLLKGVGFTQAEVGVVNKVIGIWLTIVGAMLGGAIMLRVGLYRALMMFGILQGAAAFGFWVVAVTGKDAWGSFTLPAFDLIIVSLKEATKVDWLLLSAIGLENITSGMGTAAFLAFLMALCNKKFTATQFALLSAFSSIGRVWVGPLAGVLAPTFGWPMFFIFAILAAVPGLVILWKLKDTVKQLEAAH